MRVGDTVRKTISVSVTSSITGFRTKEEATEREGEVIYVHPKGRYYAVAFDLPDGTIRECYRD